MREAGPTKIVCVGRNYLAHARELGNEVPELPLLFLKPPSALLRDGEAIRLPPESERVDFEGEIGVRLGARLRRADEATALRAIAGYVPLNDVTARDLQRRDGQWTRAKGFDTFCPVGDALPAHVSWAGLEVITRVNGVERQRGRTADMAFGIPLLLSYISGIMTLEAGDLVATGTPEGVGRLDDGDVVEVEVRGNGQRAVVRNPVLSGEGSPVP